MRKRKVPLPKEERVLPTPEFLKKHEVIEKPTKIAGQKILYVTDQLWIDTYFKKGVIDYDQYQTAQRLLGLYMASGRNQKLTATLSDKVVGKDLSNDFLLPPTKIAIFPLSALC